MSKGKDSSPKDPLLEEILDLSGFVPSKKASPISVSNGFESKIESLQKQKSLGSAAHDISSAGSLTNLVQGNFTQLLNTNQKKVDPDSDKNSLIPDVKKENTVVKPRSRLGRAWDWDTAKGIVRVLNVGVPALAFGGIGALS